MDISQNRLFCILFSDFSNYEAQLTKHMKITRTARHSSIIHDIDLYDGEAFPKRTSEASKNSKLNAPDGTVIQQASQQAHVSAVNYNAAKSRSSQILRYTALNETSSQNVQD